MDHELILAARRILAASVTRVSSTKPISMHELPWSHTSTYPNEAILRRIYLSGSTVLARLPVTMQCYARNSHLLCKEVLKRRRCFCASACSISATSVTERRAQLKDDLKKAVANTGRGKRASPQRQAEILRRIKALEAITPTTEPTSSGLLSGSWSLLYTGPGAEDDVEWEKRTGGLEGPVLAALRPLSVNAIRSRGVIQVIDAEKDTVENIAEFRVANLFDGHLNVAGELQPSRTKGKETTRVEVAFNFFSLKLGSLPALRIPLNWPRRPTGFVDTTFLDQDFRIGRGDKGSVFVTARQGGSQGQKVC